MSNPEEEYVPLGKAVSLIPPAARPHHSSTVVRWAMRGIGSPRVRLESVKIGGRRYTTAHAMERFLRRVSSINAGDCITDPTIGHGLENSERELDVDGI